MKTLHTGHLYWKEAYNNKLAATFPPLDRDEQTEVAIIGGGMSGLICAAILAESGFQPILIEQQEVASGSSLANTGLLQFCNDMMLSDMQQQIGVKQANLFYTHCLTALDQLQQLAMKLPEQGGLIRRNSLYFASSEQDVPKLKQEFQALQTAGLPVAYWEQQTVQQSFPFHKAGAIVTYGDAELQPYHFLSELVTYCTSLGVKCYEHTSMQQVTETVDGKLLIQTDTGHSITATHVVYAVGYEPEQLRQHLQKATIHRTYVIVTEPLPEVQLSEWYQRMLLWETARPYYYLRTTTDNRIVVGGLDEDKQQISQHKQWQQQQSEQLLHYAQSLFPHLSVEVAYHWNALFGESQDGLPFIGRDPDHPNVYYNLGYGGNGTVYSMLAAHIIRDFLRGETHPLAEIVALDR
ncbi:NAD(P)/FAD-dependent oxidoreductase [Paenibacillus yanchengensis]|uniref:NAD(P)/FAD-dependent oxidoreductase n=1 Tax=Paenibacillus yanchengensis TaxID=2035833 RepID=A0ABW4YGN8_9BACL